MQTMGDLHIRRKVLKWGNGYGLRLTKAELEKLELVPGQEADVRISSQPQRIDLSHLRFLDDDATDVSERHDDYLEEADAGD